MFAFNVLRCELSPSFIFGFCLMLQCHSIIRVQCAVCSVHCALKLWTRVSPMWHHVCCCCTFSLSPLFIYAQITKPHSNHANMLMTFVSVPFFFGTWNYLRLSCTVAHMLMWLCVCVCVCFVFQADFMCCTFCLIFTTANDNSKQTFDECMHVSCWR